MKKILFITLLLTCCLVSCVKTDELNDTNQNTTIRASDKLSNTEWKVVRISKIDDLEKAPSTDTDTPTNPNTGENENTTPKENTTPEENTGNEDETVTNDGTTNQGANDENSTQNGTSTSGGLIALKAEEEQNSTTQKNTVDEKSRIKFENNRMYFIIYKDGKLIDGSVYKYRIAPNGNEVYLFNLANISELKYTFSLKSIDNMGISSFTNKETEEVYQVERIR